MITFLAALAAVASPSCIIVRDVANGQDVKIESHGDNGVRVRAVRTGGSFKDSPDIISALLPPAANADADVNCSTIVHDSSQQATPAALLSVTSGNLKAAVGSDGKLAFTRISDNTLLLAEKTVRVLQPTITTPSLPGFDSLAMVFNAVKGERMYGLGQHAAFDWDKTFPKNGQLDQKNLPAMLFEPHDGDVTIPVTHSSLGYVFLSNLPSTGAVEFNETGSYWLHSTVLQMDIWVATTADSPPHAISPWQQLQLAYADATGHAPVWPEWTTGFWQCKLRYANQSQIMAVANEYVKRDIPISLIIIDFFSWNDPVKKINTIGDETLPASCWPDPKLMVEQLKELGVELMVSPYSHSVGKQSYNYAEAEAKHYIATDKHGDPAASYAGGYTYDLFQPDARAYAWNAMQKGWVEQYGIHHWWLDCDEPCGGTNNGSYATDWLYNNGKWPSAFVGSAYPQMLDMAIYDGEGAPGKAYVQDNVMLGRAAWAGSQRYGGGVWSGDTRSTWQDFNQQFRAGLNMVMSGIPYWTTDIGGFGGGTTTDPDFRELVVRWFQWGAFCPLFRLHGARSGPTWPAGDPGVCDQSASNEVWMFGNESEAAIVKVMRMREQMRPYVMAQYKLAASHGTPIMRPLFYDFYNDTTSESVDDEQMFGPDYLVAPVLQKGVSSRFVYLPPLSKGTVWKNVFTGVETDTSAGGVNITEATPLDTFPLYKRHVKFVYPTPPPPAPLPSCATCSSAASSGGVPNTDASQFSRELSHFNSTSIAKCCDACKGWPECNAYTFGLFNYTSGPSTCFLLSGAVGTKTVQHRTFGCTKPPCCK